MEKKIKIVLNKCYGGFSLSRKALLRLYELNSPFVSKDGKNFTHEYRDEDSRICPLLVQVVEEMGEESFGASAKLVVEELYLTMEISQYDGIETIKYIGYY